MSEYEEFFDKADASGNGFLTYEELKAALDDKGYNEKAVEAMFSGIDLSGDGQVDKDEFLQAMGCAPPTQHKEAAMRKIFKGFDTDGSGQITKEDLKKVWQDEFGRVLDEAEMATLIDRIEGEGGDDVINYEEFLAYYSDPDRV